MDDENISQLCNELDKLLPLVSPGNNFTSNWLEQEYLTVTSMRDQGKTSYRNEYRIIKMLIESRTKMLLKNKDKLAKFVPVGRIIRDIENLLKETYNEQAQAKSINAEYNKLLDEPIQLLARERLAAIKAFIPLQDRVRDKLQQRQQAQTDFSTSTEQLFSPITAATKDVTETTQPLLGALEKVAVETGKTRDVLKTLPVDIVTTSRQQQLKDRNVGQIKQRQQHQIELTHDQQLMLN
ncbi:hypothetical protein ACJMK2_002419 [Sinanodonta woodiana]|uniref:Uncharacterized protein n=1 Tax=Sinanodonta woodiana TaxID=1069815 RepID=A0ABD3XWW7_SINWO